MNHLLIYGSNGVGKKTRINLLLKELFGKVKVSIQQKQFITASNKKINAPGLSLSEFELGKCLGSGAFG